MQIVALVVVLLVKITQKGFSEDNAVKIIDKILQFCWQIHSICFVMLFIAYLINMFKPAFEKT